MGPAEGPPSPVKLILRVLGRQERILLFLDPGWSGRLLSRQWPYRSDLSIFHVISSGAVPVFFTCVDRPLTQGRAFQEMISELI